jgi:myo-inositol-1(or 4)-monophosphatase
MSEYLEVAVTAAKKAGRYLLENKGKIKPENVNKKSINDFVTHVDHQSEKIIVDFILEEFPSHKILAEEGTSRSSGDKYRWVIDPLDGTKNFIQDLPLFSVSIGLEKSGEIITGVVYDPVHNEMFTAVKGNGAYLNDKRITVSTKDFGESIIATGFPHRAKRFLPKYLLAFEELYIRCSGMRRCGTAAIDLCYTAMGRFDGFWELGLSIWDMAAGSLILKEAGGFLSDFWGGEKYLDSGFIIAGNKVSHSELLKVTNKYFRPNISSFH